MRRLAIVVLIMPLMLLATGVCALAQIGGPPGAPTAPLAPPPPPPAAPPQAAPGAPAAAATTSALPQLAPAPRVVQAPQPAAAAPTFRCSCFGTGLGTQWIGVVQAPSYTLADRSAQSQCVAYNLNGNPPSPFIPQSSSLATRSAFPVVNPNAAPGSAINAFQGQTLAPGTTQPATLQRLVVAEELCSRCACN